MLAVFEFVIYSFHRTLHNITTFFSSICDVSYRNITIFSLSTYILWPFARDTFLLFLESQAYTQMGVCKYEFNYFGNPHEFLNCLKTLVWYLFFTVMSYRHNCVNIYLIRVPIYKFKLHAYMSYAIVHIILYMVYIYL